MDFQIVNTLPEAAWRDFLQAQPDSNVYHTPEMFRALARVRRHQPQLWAALNPAGAPQALFLPVTVTLLSPWLRPLTGRAVAYGSVVSAPGPTGAAALAAVLRAYTHRAGKEVLLTELRNISDSSQARPTLEAQGFVYEPHLNYLLDLQPAEDGLWRTLTKSCQQSVRTSRNKGAVVAPLTAREELSAAYALLKLVYARAQVPLADLSLFEAVWDQLHPAGMLHGFWAKVGDQPIGVCLLLAWRDRVIYWYGGLDREHAAYAPMEALLWQAIQWAKANGYSVFDFGGAGKPDEPYGPRKFKAKFGGALVDLGRYTHIPSAWRYRASQTGYAWLRRFL